MLQEVIPEQKRIGIMAAKNAILTPWSGVTYSIMGLVADAAGAKTAFIAAAALYIMTFLLHWHSPSCFITSRKVKLNEGFYIHFKMNGASGSVFAEKMKPWRKLVRLYRCKAV